MLLRLVEFRNSVCIHNLPRIGIWLHFVCRLQTHAIIIKLMEICMHFTLWIKHSRNRNDTDHIFQISMHESRKKIAWYFIHNPQPTKPFCKDNGLNNVFFKNQVYEHVFTTRNEAFSVSLWDVDLWLVSFGNHRGWPACKLWTRPSQSLVKVSLFKHQQIPSASVNPAIKTRKSRHCVVMMLLARAELCPSEDGNIHQ